MGAVLTLLKLLLKFPFIRIPLLFLGGLKRLGLWWVLAFVFVVVPGVFGSYSFLLSQGVKWYFAVPASVGVEIGGVPFNIIHGFANLQGAGWWDGVAILLGMMSSASTFLWSVVVWHKGNKAAEGQNLSPAWITFMGLLILGLCFVIALLVDQYVLAEEVRRMSGMTYVLSSPGEALAPMLDVLQGWSGTPEPVNNTSVINQTMQNSTMGG